MHFIGSNGACYYGDSDKCMRTFDFKDKQKLENEISDLEDYKASRKAKFKQQEEDRLQSLITQFESHIEARECHMIVYDVNTKVLLG